MKRGLKDNIHVVCFAKRPLQQLTRWKGDWKDSEESFSLQMYKSYSNWPDEKGTESQFYSPPSVSHPGVTAIDPMKRGLKVRFFEVIQHHCFGYSNWPDEKGTESYRHRRTADILHLVTAIDPMKRGLKEEPYWSMIACLYSVTAIDPMKRGLKVHSNSSVQSDRLGYSNWPDEKGTESSIAILRPVSL